MLTPDDPSSLELNPYDKTSRIKPLSRQLSSISCFDATQDIDGHNPLTFPHLDYENTTDDDFCNDIFERNNEEHYTFVTMSELMERVSNSTLINLYSNDDYNYFLKEDKLYTIHRSLTGTSLALKDADVIARLNECEVLLPCTHSLPTLAHDMLCKYSISHAFNEYCTCFDDQVDGNTCSVGGFKYNESTCAFYCDNSNQQSSEEDTTPRKNENLHEPRQLESIKAGAKLEEEANCSLKIDPISSVFPRDLVIRMECHCRAKLHTCSQHTKGSGNMITVLNTVFK